MALPWKVSCHIGTTPGLVPTGWEDISSRAQESFDASYGRSHELGRDDTGTCTVVLDNRDGRWDPGIPPHTAIRLRVIIGAVTYPVWYGLVESAPTKWPSPAGAVVKAQLNDGQGLLGRSDVVVQLPAEKSGTRIQRLLNAAAWPSAQRDIDPGVVEIEPLEKDGEPTLANVLAQLREASRAEDGHIYVAPDGKLTFRDRHARLDAVEKEAFDDSSPPVTLGTEYDDRRLFTVGRAEMADGETIEFSDDVDVAAFGRRVYEVRDLATSLVEGEAQAAWVVARYGEPRLRFDRLEVDGRQHGLEDILTLRPGDLIRVAGTPPSGAPVSELVHVEHIHHRVAGWSWRTTLKLSPYFGAGPWFKLDDSLLDSTAGLAP